MGKNHRHSKKLKSEKNKVHIKSKTKFLPKGQNVTNTAFKIKPIVLQEQLKEASTVKKKVNISELVTKLKHYNDTIKSEACQDLKDSISVSLEPIQIYFSSVVQNASALVQDRDRKVRKAAVKLLNAIFAKVSTDTLRPFFNYILTNLKCAMTNINKNIQEDSLLFLDAILEHQSVLIAENFDAFFPNFLLLISKLKNQSTERSLSLNLDGKVTSVKWRVKVLTRLYGVLKAMTQKKEAKNKSPLAFPTLEANKTVFIPMYRDIKPYERKDADIFATSKIVVTQLDCQIPNLIQLLHEIWMEAVPEKVEKKNDNGTILTSEESVAIFCCIVHILKLLGDYVGNAVFCKDKPSLFLDHLMKNFPYTHNRKNLNEVSKDFSKCFELRNDQNCVEENLIVVHLFVTLRLKNLKNGPKNKSIALYINKCLKQPNSQSFPFLLKILKDVLLKETFLCRRLSIDLTSLSHTLANCYNSPKVPEKSRNEILELLISPKLGNDRSWLEKLPQFLCEDRVSVKVVQNILDLCRRGEEVVQDGVKKELKKILENLNRLKITEVEDLEEAQKDLASIFFYLPQLSDEEIEELKKFIIFYPESSYSLFLGNVLDLRLQMLR